MTAADDQSARDRLGDGSANGHVPDEVIIGWGRAVVDLEADGVAGLSPLIDSSFCRAVRLIDDSHGRVIVTGLGKSGIIARKIAATLTSTGTLATYMHPTEALHGDVGMVRRGDVIVMISKSGETEELHDLLPVIQRMDVPVIAMTSHVDSYLGREADTSLQLSDVAEACNMDLVPTTSTTTTLALGDALAVALLQLRGFGPDDFRELHPGGSIGRSLLTVGDLMLTGDAIPVVTESAPSHEVLLQMTGKRLGHTCVVNADGRLAGIITDGDLRRSLEKGFDLGAVIASDLMTSDPKQIGADALATTAVSLMEKHKITLLVILTEKGSPRGVVHLHDLLRAKVV